MSAGTLKVIGVLCLVACAVLLFVAWERNRTNANNVAAMNQMNQRMHRSPLGEMMPRSPLGGGQMRPAMPAATKYALVFAVVAAAGGIACLVYASRQPRPGPNASP